MAYWVKASQVEWEGFPVQTPLDAWLVLGTEPHYEAPGDLCVEIVKMQ